MNVRTLGKRRRVDFRHRPDEHEMPVGTRSGDCADQPEIEPLVDDPAVSQSRTGNCGLVRRLLLEARHRELLEVNAARDGVNPRMVATLPPARAEPAGENDVGTAEELTFQRTEFSRSA